MKRYTKFGEKLDDILKYSIGWQKLISKKETKRTGPVVLAGTRNFWQDFLQCCHWYRSFLAKIQKCNTNVIKK